MLTRMNECLTNLSFAVEESLREHFVIFGSTALVLRGVDIERPVNDLDVLVSPWAHQMILPHLKIAYVDFGNNQPLAGVSLAQVLSDASPVQGSYGFPVATLDHLFIWKSCLGRQKDLVDLPRIQKYLEQRRVAMGELTGKGSEI